MSNNIIESGGTIGSFEYCFLMEKTYHSNWSFNVRIPKLMPQLSTGSPNRIKENIDRSILINDSSCKPSTSSYITTQNYKTVDRFHNMSLEYKADKYGYIHKDARFLCCFINNDIRNVRITGFD